MSEPLLPPSQPEQWPAPVGPWSPTKPEPAISSTARVSGPLTLAELSTIIRRVDPAALLLPPRLLRRIIHEDRAGLHLGFHVPHRKSHIISRAALLDIIDLEELPLEPGQQLAETVILLTAPDPDDLALQDPSIALTQCWRLLFHAAVHVALERRFAELPLTPAELEQRCVQLGACQFDEIRTVLEQEKYLPRASDARSAYVEFVAVFLELRFFDPALLACYFPGLTDLSRIECLVAEDLDAAGVLARTRLPGAVPAAVSEPAAEELEDWPEEDAAWSDLSDQAGWLGRLVQRVANGFVGNGGIAANLRHRRFIRQAKRAARRGNTVRAAILRTAAAGVADSVQQATVARTAARADLDHLATRFQAALELDPSDRKAWRRALGALLEPAARGFWPAEARFLYDLQKICIDHERAIYAVDVMAWLLSWGRRPIKRPLPHEAIVRLMRHLRGAHRHLGVTHIPENVRHSLAALLRTALEHSERRLRNRFRGQIVQVLDEVGMRPANFVECVARDKLVEEVLDHVSERGHLGMGDLRDAVSRNNLKLPDLARPAEFFRGDRLLETNRRLAVTLDGVYRRGEVYLRWLQRLSAAAFATPVGRFLTRYIALPFGGAFVALKGVEEIVNLVRHALGLPHLHLATRYSVPSLGLLLFGLLYVPAFRQGVVQAVGLIYHGLRAMLYDIPVWLLHVPAVRAVLASRAMTLFRRHLARPLLITIVAALALYQAGLAWPTWGWITAAVFLGSYLLLNSRLGRQLDEAATDWVFRTGRRFARDLLPGVIRFLVYMYKELIRDVERVIYTVDEWLRFRQGQSQAALVTKAVLGVGWFFATYLIRIYLNLMIEPTINPVKHFPVVTVAAKIITPLSWKIGPQIALVLLPVLPYGVAFPLVMANLLLLPGFFGFLVWELKENWRLYQANRPRTLQPVVIGHHGETMLRLLKPGIHSGTLPKLYARLRKAEQRARQNGRWKAVRRQRHALEAVNTGIRRFIEREFLALLAAGKEWQDMQLTLDEVRTATNQVQAAFHSATLESDLWLRFELQNGGLAASIVESGWQAQLTAEQAQVMQTALAGLYQMAGDRTAAKPLTWEWWVATWSMGGRPASAGWQNNAPVAKANLPGG